MKVKELIAELQSFDEEKEVNITFKGKSITYGRFSVREGMYFELEEQIDSSMILGNNKVVMIEVIG
jgi:hypothetical protein